MSFTSTLSVRTRTALVLSCGWFSFFAIITKMKMILKSAVGLIIIGNLMELIVCNRQFYSVPPIPYYQNDGYYYPDVPNYGEPSPYFYNSHNVLPHPTPYTNYYMPSQLFQQNENYHPPQGIYPHMPSNEMNYAPSMTPPQGMNVDYSMMNPNPTFGAKDLLPNQRPPHVPQQDTKFYNIIEKEKDFQPYYHDDYNKNYHEDDYDNYNDDDQGDPCVVTYPYHYFEASRKNPNMFDGSNLKKYSPCYPHFQPDFRGKIYTFKAPITLLPSRFPPRIEEIIERIQNYFSTYTQQQMQGAQNSSSSSSSSSSLSSSSLSASSATDTPSTMITNNENQESITSPPTDHHLHQHHHDKNKTGENEHSMSKVGTPLFNSANIKLERSETTVNSVSDEVTEKAEVLTTHLDNGVVSTTTTEETHNGKTSQVHEQLSQSPSLVMHEIADVTETVSHSSNQPEGGHHDAQMTSTEVQNHLAQETSTSESLIQQSIKEIERTSARATDTSHSSESETVPPSVQPAPVNVDITTEPTRTELKTEAYDFLTTTNEVFTTEKS